MTSVNEEHKRWFECYFGKLDSEFLDENDIPNYKLIQPKNIQIYRVTPKEFIKITNDKNKEISI